MRRYRRHTSDTAQSDIVHRATKVQRRRRGRGWVAAHTNHFHPLNCSLLPLRNCHQSFFNANTDFRLLLCRTPLMSHPNAHGQDPWAKPPGSAAENTSDDWFQRGVGVSGALGGWVSSHSTPTSTPLGTFLLCTLCDIVWLHWLLHADTIMFTLEAH